MTLDNNYSIVCVDDTVDFGTIDFCDSVESAYRINKDDKNQSGSDHEKNHGMDNDKNKNHHNIGLDQQHTNYLNVATDSTIIDNRKLVYIPVHLVSGICAYCSPDVLKHCPMVLREIQVDLVKVFSILPVSVHSLLRRTNLWLNYNGYAYGPKANPRILRHVTTHHHPAWLVERACDTPQKALGIEIYSCVYYQNMRLHWNGSGLLLHEFCHLIHQCCLEDGLENQTVIALYETADASGRYEKVLRRDWAGKKITTPNTPNICASELKVNPNWEEDEITDSNFADSDLAYAMVDAKEFFAELSVAYFCKAYRSLDHANSFRMEACSPPLLHPDVVSRVEILIYQRQHVLEHEKATNSPETYKSYDDTTRGYEYQQIGYDGGDENDPRKLPCHNEDENLCCWTLFAPIAQFLRNIAQRRPFLVWDHNLEDDPWLRLTNVEFRETAMSHNCANISHCNKFYPFTRGQLKHHDPELFEKLSNLWIEISMWEDPFASIRTRKRMSRSFSCRC